MTKKKSLKRELIEWGIFIAVGLGLYISGYHVEVIGKLQQLLLYTGIRQPEIMEPHNREASINYSWSIKDTTGRVIPVSRYRGKVLFINFRASWCPPCVAEMPNIHSLYKDMKNDSLVFLMISLDRRHEDGMKFIRDKGFSFPVYFPASPLPNVLRSETIPTTFVIDKKGRIAVKETGYADYDNEDFKNALNKLLME